MSRQKTTPEEARAAFWCWFAFDEFEHLDLDAVTDAQYGAIEDAARALLSTLCDAVGHRRTDDAYGACVFCNRPMSEVLGGAVLDRGAS